MVHFRAYRRWVDLKYFAIKTDYPGPVATRSPDEALSNTAITTQARTRPNSQTTACMALTG